MDTIENMDTSEMSSIVKTIVSLRASRTFLKAINNLKYVSNDPRTFHQTKKLINAGDMFQLIIKRHKKFQDFTKYRENRLEPFILAESENLIKAINQRVSNTSYSYDNAKFSYNNLPYGVRIYYEACEFVVTTILELFDKPDGEPDFVLYKPYVFFDTVDSPEHYVLSIQMPEYLKLSLLPYPALSHESLHSFVYQSKITPKSLGSKLKEPLNLYCAPYSSNRLRLFDEIYVELFDFSFSFAENHELYFNDVWYFFANHFKNARKEEITIDDLKPYIIRTFCVDLYQYSKKKDYSVTEIISIKPTLRSLLRTHLEQISDIIGGTKIGIEKESFFRNSIHEFQNDLTLLIPFLEIIFHTFDQYKEIYKDELVSIADYSNSDSLKQMTKEIIAGEILNKEINYPHILIYSIVREFNNTKGYKEETKTTLALLLSLWNAKNLKSFHQRDKVNE